MTHPFQDADLGRPPFKLVRCEEAAVVGPSGKARGGTGAKCDYCGQNIRWVFYCESADGRSFQVGKDCVGKVEPAGSSLRTDVERKFKEQQKEAIAARVQRAKENLIVHSELLRDQRHPKLFNHSLTMRDYVEFVFKNATSDATLRRACIIVESHLPPAA